MQDSFQNKMPVIIWESWGSGSQPPPATASFEYGHVV